MTQEELDRRIIRFVIGAFTLCFVAIVITQKKECKTTPARSVNDTIRIYETRIDTLVLKQVKRERIYETKIDTIYMLDSAGVTREYARAIQELDSLSKSGFFNQR